APAFRLARAWPAAGRADAAAQAPAPVRLSLRRSPGERGPGCIVRTALGPGAAQQLRLLGQRLRSGAVARAGGAGGRCPVAGDVLGGRTGSRPARGAQPRRAGAAPLPRDRTRIRAADAVAARPPAAQPAPAAGLLRTAVRRDRKSTRLNSSHVKISYAVFCLKKKKKACT